MKNYQLQIGKIVGMAADNSWSQIHSFIPEEADHKKNMGVLLASISLKTKNENKELDINLFGKEIISRFHELYYGGNETNIFLNLKTSLKAITDEFSSQIRLSIAAAVLLEKETLISYLATVNSSSIYLWREGNLYQVFEKFSEEAQVASGLVLDNDKLVVASEQFFQLVSQGSLKAILDNASTEEEVETLSSIVHGHESNSLTSALICQISKINADAAVDKVSLKKNKPKIPTIFKNFLSNLKPSLQKMLADFKDLRKKQALYVKDEQHKSKAKKTTLTVAIALIALLLISIFFGLKRGNQNRENQLISKLQSDISYKYEQAMSLKDLNPLRARTLLLEAQAELSQKIPTINQKNEQKKLNDLLSKVQNELANVAKEYKVENADIFLDLTLAKDQFRGTAWALIDENLYIFDSAAKTILSVDINKKSYEIVGGGDKLNSGRLIAASASRLYVLAEKKIIIIDLSRTEVIGEKEAQDWGEIKDMTAFSGNAYLLDKQKGEIWKYTSTDSGLGNKSSYLKKADDQLNLAISLAIDGSVWVLLDSGQIIKYTRGTADYFSVSGLDKPFVNPLQIFTNEDQKNLYILDYKNTRVVVISKDTGEYQAQYVWPGIAGVTNIVALEDKKILLLLSGERIYKIDLR